MRLDTSEADKQRVLLLGASGFIGSSVAHELTDDFDVCEATHKVNDKDRYYIDTESVDSIVDLLLRLRPAIIINCAGVVENSKKASMNVVITKNLLQAVVESGITVHRIVILGSAAEYGEVGSDLPVSEESECLPFTDYGKSKLAETTVAIKYREKDGLPVTVLRIFNPIGRGMQDRFLATKIMRQLDEFKSGFRKSIEISRLDATRDYLDVKDIAKAIRRVIESNPQCSIYNVGSGSSTSNKQLLDLIVCQSSLAHLPSIVETATLPEPKVASCADITKIRNELGWKPSSSLEDVIKDVIDAR